MIVKKERLLPELRVAKLDIEGLLHKPGQAFLYL